MVLHINYLIIPITLLQSTEIRKLKKCLYTPAPFANNYNVSKSSISGTRNKITTVRGKNK